MLLLSSVFFGRSPSVVITSRHDPAVLGDVGGSRESVVSSCVTAGRDRSITSGGKPDALDGWNWSTRLVGIGILHFGKRCFAIAFE